ncbi:hypothetical protein DRN87_06095 [Candidatus Geothermarchaeota archaeon]|nr:MAG: hypothetical protein DRN87_06095 [Candidatus Geothermarchaeota archaeon]
MGLDDLSVVLPVYNEAYILRYSLPSLLRLYAGEYIVILDRPRDYSRELILHYFKRFNIKTILNIIEYHNKSPWRNRLNYLYHIGILEASRKYVLLAQADVILDPLKIERYYRYNGLVSYSMNYLNPYLTILKRIKTVGRRGFSGTLSFPRKHYLRNPMEPDSPLGFDEEIRRIFNNQYLYVRDAGFNLRPYKDDYRLGKMKRILGMNLLKVLLWSMLHLKPKVFVGYLNGMRYEKYEKRPLSLYERGFKVENYKEGVSDGS